jgi:hypothetical protein
MRAGIVLEPDQAKLHDCARLTMKGLALYDFSFNYSASRTRRSKSWYRGSPRKGSKRGSTFKVTSVFECWRRPFRVTQAPGLCSHSEVHQASAAESSGDAASVTWFDFHSCSPSSPVNNWTIQSIHWRVAAQPTKALGFKSIRILLTAEIVSKLECAMGLR